MNPEVADILAAYLPREIVAEIEDHLVISFRIDNAKKCAEIWSRDVEVIVNTKYTPNGLAYRYEECGRCGEMKSRLIRNFNTLMGTHQECSGTSSFTRRDFRRRPHSPFREKIRNVLETLFAPHKFRESYPFWMERNYESLALCGYNSKLRIAFRHFPEQYYRDPKNKILYANNKGINKYARKCCRNQHVRLIEIPFYITDFTSLMWLIRKAMSEKEWAQFGNAGRIAECEAVWNGNEGGNENK